MYIIVEVGYTGLKKGLCFKFLGAPAHMKRNVALSILMPFSAKLTKNEGATKKKKIGLGSKEWSEN